MPKTKPPNSTEQKTEDDESIGKAAIGYLIGALLVCVVGIVSMVASSSRIRHGDDAGTTRHGTTNINIVH